MIIQRSATIKVIPTSQYQNGTIKFDPFPYDISVRKLGFSWSFISSDDSGWPFSDWNKETVINMKCVFYGGTSKFNNPVKLLNDFVGADEAGNEILLNDKKIIEFEGLDIIMKQGQSAQFLIFFGCLVPFTGFVDPEVQISVFGEFYRKDFARI